MTDETRFQRTDIDSNVPSLSLNIRIKSTEAIQNILLTVNVHSPLYAQPNEIRIGHIGGSYISIKSSIKSINYFRSNCYWYSNNRILDAR
jgi:hypothetical protein